MLNGLVMQIAEFCATLFPFDCMNAAFMQRALLALLLIAPLAGISGLQVVNARMAFFSDAISHSAFAGVAIGVLCGFSTTLSMPLTAVAVGALVMFLKQGSRLSSDTVIGVIFSAVAAFGLAIVAKDPGSAGNIQMFLFGDILMISTEQIAALGALLAAFIVFQCFAFNRLVLIGINPMLAAVHKVRVNLYQYCFAVLLSLVVIYSVRAAGVVLVTALLIVPAAAARNFARNTRQMFILALLFSYIACIGGLIASAQEEINIPAGSAIVLCAVILFIFSEIFAAFRPRRTADSGV